MAHVRSPVRAHVKSFVRRHIHRPFARHLARSLPAQRGRVYGKRSPSTERTCDRRSRATRE
eukprot:scaffold546_cov352-Prasinococcus_capsulatus_cf.AAC.12